MNKQNGAMLRQAWRICIGLLLGSLALAAQAQTVVEAVSSSIQGGVEVVRVDFSQPLTAIPAGFTIQAPARIALDIPGA
jgi:type IV pilus assembly protein PilQ